MKTYTDTQAWTLLDRAFYAHPLLVMRAMSMMINAKRHRLNPTYTKFASHVLPLLHAAGLNSGHHSSPRGVALSEAAGHTQIKLNSTKHEMAALDYALCTSFIAPTVIKTTGIEWRAAPGLCQTTENGPLNFNDKAPWCPAWAAVIINAELKLGQCGRLVRLAKDNDAAQTALRIGGVAGLKAYAGEE